MRLARYTISNVVPKLDETATARPHPPISAVAAFSEVQMSTQAIRNSERSAGRLLAFVATTLFLLVLIASAFS